jgi:catechol 2,3-dioxygenase-like lactoylglutathione lyase family enzyme
MDLGAFSVSLAVKDLAVSLAFYELLGFSKFHGDEEHGWLILKNGDTAIGLFQGMFEENLMTFNPGMDANFDPIEGEWTDVRELRERCLASGVPVQGDPIKTTSGPAHFTVTDPDGNTILLDQHR